MHYELLEGAMKNQIKKNGEKGIYFFNFELPTVITCPSAPNACKEICFAIKRENTYNITSENKGASLKKHYKNLLLTFNCNIEDFNEYLNNHINDEDYKRQIKEYISKEKWLFDNIRCSISTEENEDLFVNLMVTYIYKKYKELETVNLDKDKWGMLIRIHYSGDFYNNKYFDKWVKITNKFPRKEYGHLYFMAYTKEIEMIEKYLIYNKLKLNDVNIKIVFSVMENSKAQNNTGQEALDAYDRLKNSGNSLTKHTVYAKACDIPDTVFRCILPKKEKCCSCLLCYNPENKTNTGTTVL